MFKQFKLYNLGSYSLMLFLLLTAASSAIPIADIRGVDSMNYTKGEKLLRCKVAAAFRLMDLFGWCSGLNSNMSVSIVGIRSSYHYMGMFLLVNGNLNIVCDFMIAPPLLFVLSSVCPSNVC